MCDIFWRCWRVVRGTGPPDDATAASKIDFMSVWQTPAKYLIEAMGGGVAMIDADGDGKSIFLCKRRGVDERDDGEGSRREERRWLRNRLPIGTRATELSRISRKRPGCAGEAMGRAWRLATAITTGAQICL